jgi:hypothetical protein
VVAVPPEHGANATTTLSYNGADHAAQVAAPATDAPGASTPSATPPPQAPATQKKPGFFGKIGRFFKRVFGAE